MLARRHAQTDESARYDARPAHGRAHPPAAGIVPAVGQSDHRPSPGKSGGPAPNAAPMPQISVKPTSSTLACSPGGCSRSPAPVPVRRGRRRLLRPEPDPGITAVVARGGMKASVLSSRATATRAVSSATARRRLTTLGAGWTYPTGTGRTRMTNRRRDDRGNNRVQVGTQAGEGHSGEQAVQPQQEGSCCAGQRQARSPGWAPWLPHRHTPSRHLPIETSRSGHSLRTRSSACVPERIPAMSDSSSTSPARRPAVRGSATRRHSGQWARGRLYLVGGNAQILMAVWGRSDLRLAGGGVITNANQFQARGFRMFQDLVFGDTLPDMKWSAFGLGRLRHDDHSASCSSGSTPRAIRG